MLSTLDRLKQAFEDLVRPASDHESAIKSVRVAVTDIRERCPDLQLECVFNGLPAGGGSYEARQADLNAAELLHGLNDSERKDLRQFVEAKLREVEKLLAAA